MSSIKSLLKQAKEAIGSGDYDSAIDLIAEIHEIDPKNYHSFVFLGLANAKKLEITESEAAYEKAISIDPNQPLAYQGLVNLFESAEDRSDKLKLTYERVIDLYIGLNDSLKAFEIWKKLLNLAEADSSNPLYLISVLRMHLPGSQIFSAFNSNPDISLDSPLEILQRIAGIREDYDCKWVERECELRRRRLGSDPYPILRKKVEAEAILGSDLAETYLQILQHVDQGNPKYVSYSIKLLEFMHRRLMHVDSPQKPEVLDKVLGLSQELLNSKNLESILHIRLLVELQDLPLSELDDATMEKGLSITNTSDSYYKVIEGWQKWKDQVSPSELLQWLDSVDDSVKMTRLYMSLRCETLFKNRKFDETIDCIQSFQAFLNEMNLSTGISFSGTHLGLDLLHGLSLLELGAKFLPLALTQFRKVLSRDSQNIEGLFGLGRVLLGLQKYEEAKKAFNKVLTLDPTHILAKSELGWVCFKSGQIQESLQMLLSLETETGAHYLLKYRLAYINWERGGDYRTDKNYTFKYLIDAARLNPNFAPTFALLGQFYQEIENDIQRAIKCFVKALSIDPSEELAANALSCIWLQQDMVDEAIALLTRFIEYAPRTAWAWKRLGIQSLMKRNGQDAITQFQTSLRIASDDVLVWTSLGEAYTMEGRHMAAIKALDRALSMDSDSIHARYIKATVEHKVGLLPDAIHSYEFVLEILTRRDASRKSMLPIWKSLSECLIDAAAESYQKGGYGACHTYLGHVLRYCFVALQVDRDNITFLTLVGDACFSAYKCIPELAINSPYGDVKFLDQVEMISKLLITTPIGQTITTDVDIIKTASSSKILDCSILAYKTGIDVIRNTPDSVFEVFLSDLYERHGIVLAHMHSCLFKNGIDNTKGSSSWLEQSVKSFKLALAIRPLSASTWNSLAMCLIDVDPKIAQGSLIRAIELDPQDATPWVNLGLFYLKHEDLELAKLAFLKAQFIDPDSSLGWFGQGLVERKLGNENAASTILAHAFEIGQAGEVDVLYYFAEACYNNRRNKDFVGNGSQLTSASYCLLKCVERYLSDPSIYNLRGLVLERQGMYDSAVDVFYKALEILETIHSPGSLDTLFEVHLCSVMENLGRVLCSAKRFEEGKAVFNKLFAFVDGNRNLTLEPYPYVGLGLCHFFLGELAESLLAFEKALAVCEGLSESQSNGNLIRLKNDTKLLLSQVLFALGSENHIGLAKEQLLECFQLDSMYVKAIVTLAVMGLVYSDIGLAQTAAAELIQLDADQRGSMDQSIDQVLSALFAIQGENNVARRFLLKAIHRYPWKAARWSNYADWIKRVRLPDNMRHAEKSAQAAAALVPSLMTQERNIHSSEVTSIHRVTGISFLAGGRKCRHTKLQFYRAIRSSPSTMHNWIALGLFQTAKSSEDLSEKKSQLLSKADTHKNQCLCLKSIGASVRVLGAKDPDVLQQLSSLVWERLFHLEETLVISNHPEHVGAHQEMEHLLQQHQESLSDITKQAVLTSLGRSAFAHSQDIAESAPYLEQAIKIGTASTGFLLPLDIIATIGERIAKPSLSQWGLTQISLQTNDESGRVSSLLKFARLNLLLNETTAAMETIQEVLSKDSQNSLAKLLQLALMIHGGSSNTSKLDKLAEGLKGEYPTVVEWLQSRSMPS